MTNLVSEKKKKKQHSTREIEDSDLVVFNCSSLAPSAVSAFYKSLMCNIKIKNSLMTKWSLFFAWRDMWVEKYLCTQRHAPHSLTLCWFKCLSASRQWSYFYISDCKQLLIDSSSFMHKAAKNDFKINRPQKNRVKFYICGFGCHELSEI